MIIINHGCFPKVENDSIFLYQVGPHENFYKNLKKYLKEIGE